MKFKVTAWAHNDLLQISVILPTRREAQAWVDDYRKLGYKEFSVQGIVHAE
jgi:hypothetical protein